MREVLGAHVAVRLEAAQVDFRPSSVLPASLLRLFCVPSRPFSPAASQKTRPDALAFLSDFVIDAVVEQFARDIVLECTRERSREALFLLKEEREISRLWDDLITDEITAGASAVIEECKAEQAALAKKAQPQVQAAAPLPPFAAPGPRHLLRNTSNATLRSLALALVMRVAGHIFSPSGLVWGQLVEERWPRSA